ncbi:hypothetical protein GCM10022243_29760 [Saccharothrix violaceirubra]|uniref:Uncharacterized protein n=1 Tax=Saccharothrix violaceirubra TaxID=413306 RepID=A0A7W7T7C5_9PSEU|nr:hypothetical protein [Saccharothrix violaceirubra]MBB4966600.1 hypothetical protein [Saccharothrix violaceirubra]
MTPLGGVPLFGDLVTALDGVLVQVGLPPWFAALLELVVVVVAAYLLLWLVVRHVLPWLGRVLVGPLLRVVEGVRVLLLLPDLGATRLARRFGRMPPEAVYAYGAVVMGLVDGLGSVVRKALPVLSLARRTPRAVLFAALALGFVLWNAGTCGPLDEGCVEPVAQWTTSLTAWFERQ